MVFILSFVISHGILSWFTYASAKHCDPSNYICSGRCPDVPPEVHLAYGKSVCRKDSDTRACVCWLQTNTSQQLNSLFLCEAKINGTKTQVLCQPPAHCFPPDSEPTCLIIANCDCQYLNGDESIAKEFGKWKLVKAFVETSEHSKKYPSDVREFSLKHLLFLLAFVIAPLFCWCGLNFINANRCKRKSLSLRETMPISAERNTINSHTVQEISENPQPNEPLINSVDSSSNQPPSSNLPFGCLSNDTCISNCSDLSSVPHIMLNGKFENPPSYDVAVSNEVDHDDGPPPSYEDAVHLRESTLSWSHQPCFMVHSNPHPSL